jgi:hypothetical protein
MENFLTVMRAILGFVTLLFLVGWIAVADGTDSAFAGLKKKKKKKQVEGDFAEEDSAKSLVVVQGTISHIVLGSIRIKAKYAQIMETHSFQIHSNTILDCSL